MTEHSNELVLNIVSWIIGKNLLLIDIIYHRATPSRRGAGEMKDCRQHKKK